MSPPSAAQANVALKMTQTVPRTSSLDRMETGMNFIGAVLRLSTIGIEIRLVIHLAGLL